MEHRYARLEGTALELKSVAADRRTFAGLATTPDLDRQGHSVDPAGVTFRNPIPLFLEHDRRPVGFVTLGTPTAAGVPFEATIPTIPEPGTLRDRVNEAWHLVQSGLIRAVSIGFRVLADAAKPIRGGGIRLLKTEILELSLTSIPANPAASILFVKSLTAIGPPPGAAIDARDTRAHAMTLTEQIRSYEATRTTKAAAMVALMTAANDRGDTLSPDEREQYDTLDLEVKSFDEHITRARRAEALNMTAATPVPAAPAPAGRFPVVSIKSNTPPGTAFVRGALALLRANGNRYEAIEHAKAWTDTPEVALWLKAAVAPGNTVDPAWAGVLAQAGNVTEEFVALLRPATILGKIANLKKVPFNVSVPIQTLGGVYGWTGQGGPKKVTKLGFGTDKLPITKATGIIVLTEELVRSSSPSAEAICRADMIAGIAQFLDQQFVDPAVAEVANVNPASITNGTTAIVSSGSALADIHALIASLSAAGVPLGGVHLIMSETNAFTLGMVRDPQGNRAFPGMTSAGGNVDGITVVTSNTAGTNVIALQPQFVLFADDGGVEIDLSREASLQLDDAPVAGPVVLTSLWQNNLVGLRAERFVNWKRAKLEAVKYVSGATYAPTYINPGGGGTVLGAGAGGGGTRQANAKHAG